MTHTEIEPELYEIDNYATSSLTTLESYRHESGVQIDKVAVSDGYESYLGRPEVQTTIDQMNQLLEQHPDWQPPVIDDRTGKMICNEASDMLYGDSETLHEWFIDASQAHATALYPLQHPDTYRLPSGGEIDDKSRAFFYHGLDAIGIRTRAKIMTDVVERRFYDRSEAKWMSLACGAAVPVIDALKVCNNDARLHLDLIDINDEALEFASGLATYEGGLQQVDQYDENAGLRSYQTHAIDLRRDLIVKDTLVKDFGENSYDMVDALGIFEYFPHKHSVNFLRNAYRLVDDGGVLVIANMLDDRPQMDFNRRGVGWPKLYPRSIDELTAIIDEAGIAPNDARIVIPEDGVYAVVEIQK